MEILAREALAVLNLTIESVSSGTSLMRRSESRYAIAQRDAALVAGQRAGNNSPVELQTIGEIFVVEYGGWVQASDENCERINADVVTAIFARFDHLCMLDFAVVHVQRHVG